MPIKFQSKFLGNISIIYKTEMHFLATCSQRYVVSTDKRQESTSCHVLRSILLKYRAYEWKLTCDRNHWVTLKWVSSQKDTKGIEYLRRGES